MITICNCVLRLLLRNSSYVFGQSFLRYDRQSEDNSYKYNAMRMSPLYTVFNHHRAYLRSHL